MFSIQLVPPRSSGKLVLFKRTDGAAIGAGMFVLRDELLPLTRREETLGALPESAMLLTLRPDHIWMGAVIRSDLSFESILVPRITRTAFSPMLLSMCVPPALHARARFVGIAFHPLPTVLAALLRICVRHRTLHTCAISIEFAASVQ